MRKFKIDDVIRVFYILFYKYQLLSYNRQSVPCDKCGRKYSNPGQTALMIINLSNSEENGVPLVTYLPTLPIMFKKYVQDIFLVTG